MTSFLTKKKSELTEVLILHKKKTIRYEGRKDFLKKFFLWRKIQERFIMIGDQKRRWGFQKKIPSAPLRLNESAKKIFVATQKKRKEEKYGHLWNPSKIRAYKRTRSATRGKNGIRRRKFFLKNNFGEHV